MNGQTDRLEHMESDTDEQIYIKEECWGILGNWVHELLTSSTLITASNAFQKQPEQSFWIHAYLDVHCITDRNQISALGFKKSICCFDWMKVKGLSVLFSFQNKLQNPIPLCLSHFYDCPTFSLLTCSILCNFAVCKKKCVCVYVCVIGMFSQWNKHFWSICWS